MAEISYIKTDWVNNETKLNAENMNHIENGIEALDTALETKLDKLTGMAKVYRTNPESNLDDEYSTYTSSSSPKTFMVRDENANTYVSTPTHPSHCATKQYVDNKTNFDIVYISGDIDISKVSRVKWIANLTTNNIVGYQYFHNSPLYFQGVQQTEIVDIDFVNENIGYLMTGPDYAQYYSDSFSEFYLDSGMTQQLTLNWFSMTPYWAVNSISYIVYK